MRRVRGASRLGCVTAVAVLGLLTYVGIPFFSLEMRFLNVREEIRDHIAQITAPRATEVEDRVAAKVRELGLPPSAERVRVRMLPGGARRFLITVVYSDTVTLLAWSWVRPRSVEAATPCSEDASASRARAAVSALLRISATANSRHRRGL